jgi:hypothetical protein
MKRAAIFLAVAALAAAPASVMAAEPFSAALTPEAEVPPATSDGSGSATATINDEGTEIAYEVTYSGLTGPVLAAHIHFGAADEAGGVIFPLAHGASPFSGTLTEADFTPLDGGPQTFAEGLDAIRAGMTYINVHTEANQGGEIRGQLRELPDTALADIQPRTWGVSAIAIMAVAGLAAFVVFSRRLAYRRA